MYSDVPSYACFPTDNHTDGKNAHALPSLGILYRDYISDYRVFSCPNKPTIAQLAGLGPTVGAVPSSHPLDATMTHYGYDCGNKGTGYKPHTPSDSLAVVVADYTAPGKIPANHGNPVGQNILRCSGSVECFDSLQNTVATGP